MARINIEDSIWKDDRFQDLMIKTGNRHTAKGMILELWTLAQEYWFPERKLIPLDRIRQAGLQLVVDVGLAVIQEAGVKAIGTDKAFDWLFQRQAAGKAGGKANALRLEAVASRSLNDREANESKSKQIEASFSISNSINTNTAPAAPDFFEEIYRIYPKRKGTQRKKQGMKTLASQFSDPEKAGRLIAAIRRYRRECEAEKKIGTPYVMQFATFLGVWEEYERPASDGPLGALKTPDEIEREMNERLHATA